MRKLRLLLVWLGSGYLVPGRLRIALYRAAKLAIAADVKISPRLHLTDGTALSIGERTFVNHDLVVSASAPVSIGAGVFIGPRVTLMTNSHVIGGPDRRAGTRTPLPISIGDGCWIAVGAIVLAGVTVAPGCVVAAGAVVTADTQPNGLYGGVPARRLRDLGPGETGGAGAAAAVGLSSG